MTTLLALLGAADLMARWGYIGSRGGLCSALEARTPAKLGLLQLVQGGPEGISLFAPPS